MTKAASGTSSDNTYTSSNLRKYQSPNRLKRRLVRRMQDRIIELAAECCAGSGTPRILDAGCGEGLNAMLLEKRLPGARIVLLDASEDALDYARTLCSEKCDFQCGSVTELPFPDGSFDLVMCTEVLEHLEQPETALAELLRVSSGHVLISVPHEPWFCAGNLLALQNVKRLGNPPDHLNHWTSGSFHRWIRRHISGWTPVFYRSFPWLITLLRRDR